MLVHSRSRDVLEVKGEADREREQMLTKLASLEGEARILRNALEDSNGRVRGARDWSKGRCEILVQGCGVRELLVCCKLCVLDNNIPMLQLSVTLDELNGSREELRVLHGSASALEEEAKALKKQVIRLPS